MHGGSLVVDNSALPPNTGAPPYPQPGQFIAISQIGGPTLWVRTTGTATPAVWATRFSVFDTSATSGYRPGDLIAFAGSPSGTFSQQVAIIVDATTSPGGAITQWHFLWGGLYDPSSAPTTMTPDTAHSSMHGTSGAFTPHWSGWSVLNNQTISNPGTSYSVGDVVTLTAAGATVNNSHYPKLVVEAVSGGGIVVFDWLDYGSFSALPTVPSALIDAGPGHFAIGPVQWTRGPFATTISSVTADSDPTKTDIVLTDAAPFPANMNIQYFYYGDDDGAAINNIFTSGATIPVAAMRLPGACGTTVPIVLPQDTSANFVNPALVGTNLQSAGLYAFAFPLGSRGETSSGRPVLNRMIYDGFANTSGGGVRDMVVEGLGIPEGYGYFGLGQSGYSDPTGYVGPSNGASIYNIPSAGDLLEIDGGKYLRIENIHATDGGIGSGNSIFHCGIDEADPGNYFNSAHVGNIIVADSRFDGNSAIAGATNPDFGLRLGNDCHDSVYRALSVYDGTTADVFQYNGNIFSQTHVNSDAANAQTAPQPVAWPANSFLAGVANYGFLAMGNTSIAQTQCDIANFACIRLAVKTSSSAQDPAQITDTQMKCGTLASVPPTYYGVELAAGAINTTVSGTASAADCNIPPAQLIHLDGAIDPTVSLCNNSNAPVSACALGNGFASGRYYTQPSLSYTTVALASGTLYAVPFVSPVGGVATKLGVQVTTAGPAGTQCELGAYSSLAGAPGALLLDSGAIMASGTGMKQNIGLPFSLAANTLYFLVVGCNGAVSVEATSSTSTLTGPLVGVSDFVTSSNTSLSQSGWTFGALPANFGTPTYVPPGTPVATPNIYLGA